MLTHRVLWLFACSLFVAPGIAMSLTWLTTSVLALIPACAFLIGLATIHYNLLSIDATAPSPLRLVTRNVANYAFVGSIVMVAVVGLSALLGTYVLLVCILLAGSSPGALRFYRRRFERVGVVTSHQQRSDDPPPTGYPPSAVEREARELTDTELCQVWQASFHALRAATSPALQAKIVDTRQVYLDEFAHRNAAGLSAWVSARTGVPEDASPVFSSPTQDNETPIDWDALMFGQDDS